jgi:hypothetical protein
MSEKRTLSLEYTNIYQHYKTSDLKSYSYIENSISPKFYFHATPKWSLFVGYRYGAVDYNGGGNNSTYQEVSSGIIGTLLSKAMTHIEIGERKKTYKESERGEVTNPVFKFTLFDKFTPDTRGALQYSHTVEESIYTNNPYYISDDVRVNIEHNFTYKTIGSFGIEYTHNGYHTETTETEDNITKKRGDSSFQPQFGLKYYFRKWISADLNYIYTVKDSNFSDFKYRDSKLIGGINGQF